MKKCKIPKQSVDQVSTAKEKMSERKKKLKRGFDYDAEMGFLLSFQKLKFKNMTIDEFQKLTKESLVDTNMVSDAVFEFFIEDIKVKEKIKQKQTELTEVTHKVEIIQRELKELVDYIEDKDDEMDLDDLNDNDDYLCGMYS